VEVGLGAWRWGVTTAVVVEEEEEVLAEVVVEVVGEEEEQMRGGGEGGCGGRWSGRRKGRRRRRMWGRCSRRGEGDAGEVLGEVLEEEDAREVKEHNACVGCTVGGGWPCEKKLDFGGLYKVG
jgi:hypothetical protein